MMESFDISNESFGLILKEIKSDNGKRFEHLDTLCNMFAYGDPEQIQNVSPSIIAMTLLDVLKNDQNIKIQETSSLCIYNFLESHQGSTRALLSYDGFGVFREKLELSGSMEIIENIIRSLYTVSKYRPEFISQSMPLSLFFRLYDFLCTATQRTVFQTIINITRNNYDPSYCEILTLVSQFFSHSDNRLSNYSLDSFLFISQNANPNDFPRDCVDIILSYVLMSKNNARLIKMIEILIRMSNNQDLAIIMMKNVDFFSKMTLNQDIPNNEVLDSMINLISSLLPSPKTSIPKSFLLSSKRNNNESIEFGVSVQPILESLLLENIGSQDTILWGYFANMTYHKSPISIELCRVFSLLLNKSECLFPIIAIMSITNDKTIFAECGLLKLIKSISEPEKEVKWYRASIQRILKGFNDEESEAKGEMLIESEQDIILNQKHIINTVSSLSPNSSQSLIRFLHQIDSVSEKTQEVLCELAKQILNSLKYIQIEKSSPIDSGSFLERSLHIVLDHFGEQVACESMGAYATGISIEGVLIRQMHAFAFDNIKAEIEKNPMYQRLVIIGDQPSKSTLSAIVYKSLNTDYKDFYFSYNDHDFSIFEPLWFIANDCDSIEPVSPLNLIAKAGVMPRTPRNVMKMVPNSYGMALDILEQIHRLLPYHVLESKHLSSHFTPLIKDSLRTASLNTFSSSIVYHYPYLFTFDIRLLLSKFAFFDTYYTLSTNQSNERFKEITPHIKLIIDRNRIFEDGLFYLERINGPIRISAEFLNETGIGTGPTQEFLSKLTQEFCRSSLGLWITQSSNEEYCFSNIGLYPSPAGSISHFKNFGKLCGRTLINNYLVDCPLSESFFKLLKGERIRLEDAFPELHKSFKNKEGLLDLNFTFPGIPSLELLPNGINIFVDQTNVDSYISLVTEYAVGKPAIERIEAFKDGFCESISPSLFQIFSASELNAIFCGSLSYEWSITDLENNIVLEHGYDLSSTPIRLLFEFLLSMSTLEKKLFIKFITGNSRLPIGGIAALNPKLCVAKKPGNDNLLPSVLTCKNYLKMSPYKDFDTLKEKFLYAINHACEGFEFT